MRFLTTLLCASCASRAQVQAQEFCQVTTRLIGQITQLSYSLTTSNTSFEDGGSQTQQTGGLVLASRVPSTTAASPSQATLNCATDIPGFDNFCGKRPGPKSVIERTLQKRRLFSYQECVEACSVDEICMGVAFRLADRKCDLYSYISYLIASRTFETFVKRPSSRQFSSPVTTISRGAQSTPPTSPVNTDSTGKALSTALASHQVSSWSTEYSQSLVILTTTTQSLSAQISFAPTPSSVSGDSLSMSPLSSQEPSTSGMSTASLAIISFSTTLDIYPTSTDLDTKASSSVTSLVTSSANSLPPVSTTTIGSSSFGSSPSTTSSASPTVPTCYFRGYDGGLGNIGFYADAVSGTVEDCDALCDANPSCLSFAVETDTPACILYNHTILGYDLYSSDSPYNFFLRGGGCPPMPTTTSSSSTSASPLPSPIFPVVSLTCTIRGSFSNASVPPFLSVSTPYEIKRRLVADITFLLPSVKTVPCLSISTPTLMSTHMGTVALLQLSMD